MTYIGGFKHAHAGVSRGREQCEASDEWHIPTPLTPTPASLRGARGPIVRVQRIPCQCRDPTARSPRPGVSQGEDEFYDSRMHIDMTPPLEGAGGSIERLQAREIMCS